MDVTFRGGVHPEEMKNLTASSRIRKMRLPKKVIIPLSQHTGGVCQPLVKVGDKVRTGDRLGRSDKFISSPVHASITGTVSAITDFVHPVLGKGKSVVVEREGESENEIEGESRDRIQMTEETIAELPADEIRGKIFAAGIVGLGGAAFPTHVKLSPPKGKAIDTFILNGAECEPYLTCDYRLMLERAEEILKGAGVIMKVLGVGSGYIGIEDNKPEAVRVMTEAAGRLNGETLQVVVLKTKYPQGAEKQLIKAVLNREVPSGGLPLDVGVVVDNVGTALAIWEALREGKPLYERVVTVTGRTLRRPGNLVVRIGTLLTELVEECGGMSEEPAAVIMGGPMMGLAQPTLEVPVIKGTCGVLVFGASEVRMEKPRACISCGRCVQACPLRLLPNYISLAVEKGRFDLAKEYGALDCFECGVCSFVCPAKRRLVDSVKYAKFRLR